ncbi:DUF421 domain-containing protein [Halobacillus andaensis]|uniref:DUF421 domain-containing protein n=1 Tax=Halobacillus andaensis TaxID=1176239 RepID=UPI003D703552
MLYLTIAIKLLFGLVGLLLLMRIVGKKSFSHVTPYDLVYTLILGGIIIPTLYDPSIHVGHILFAMVIWGGLIYTMEVLEQRNKLMTRKIKGKPSVLMEDGELNLKEIKKNHLEMEQLRVLLRQQNCFSIRDAEFVLLEIDGTVSVIKKTEDKPFASYLVINEGRIQKHALESIEIDEPWLLATIEKEGARVDDIIYGEWSKRDGLYLKRYADSKEEPFRLDN